MAFDAGNRNPGPASSPRDPPEWLDFIGRLLIMSMFAAGYIAFVGHVLSGPLHYFGILK